MSALVRADVTHPTAVPRKNIQMHSTQKFGEKLAAMPKSAVSSSVAWKGSERPRMSETTPHPTAPSII